MTQVPHPSFSWRSARMGECPGWLIPRRTGEILVNFSTFWGKLIDDLQKSDCYSLNSERKQSLTSSHGSLACVLLLLAVFWTLLVHFFRAKLILPYFSSPRGVATLDCESHSQAGSTTFGLPHLEMFCCNLCWLGFTGQFCQQRGVTPGGRWGGEHLQVLYLPRQQWPLSGCSCPWSGGSSQSKFGSGCLLVLLLF